MATEYKPWVLGRKLKGRLYAGILLIEVVQLLSSMLNLSEFMQLNNLIFLSNKFKLVADVAT